MLFCSFIRIRAPSTISIHPFSTPAKSNLGSRWSLGLSQLPFGERQVTPWAHHHSITGPHRDKWDKQPPTLTLTPRVNLETPINLKCMFLDGGRKPEYPERNHIHGKNMQPPHRKGPSWDSNHEPSCCEATVLTKSSLCCSNFKKHLYIFFFIAIGRYCDRLWFWLGVSWLIVQKIAQLGSGGT